MHALSTTLYSSHTDIDTTHNESNMPHITSLTSCFPMRILDKTSGITISAGDKPVRTVQSVQSIASAVLQATSLQEQCKACNLLPRLPLYYNQAMRYSIRYNESTHKHCIVTQVQKTSRSVSHGVRVPDVHLCDATLQSDMEVVAATTVIDTATIPSPGSNTTFDTNTGGAYIHGHGDKQMLYMHMHCKIRLILHLFR